MKASLIVTMAALMFGWGTVALAETQHWTGCVVSCANSVREVDGQTRYNSSWVVSGDVVSSLFSPTRLSSVAASGR